MAIIEPRPIRLSLTFHPPRSEAKLAAIIRIIFYGIPLKTITISILAAIGLLILVAIWQVLSGVASSKLFEGLDFDAAAVANYGKAALPSLWWIAGLFGLALIGAVPFLLGLALDGKGQSASGWLVFMGAIVSAVAVAGLLLLYLAGSLIISIFKWVFS